MSYYNTYDSDPQSQTNPGPGGIIGALGSLEKHDYGIVTSLGWSF